MRKQQLDTRSCRFHWDSAFPISSRPRVLKIHLLQFGVTIKTRKLALKIGRLKKLQEANLKRSVEVDR
jgi:hypothetical protein